MIKVWILVLFMGDSGYQKASGGPAVIDNIANEQECLHAARKIMDNTRYYEGAVCLEVMKRKV